MNQEPIDESAALITFARLPIFDDKKNLYGYELVYLSEDTITAKLISDTATTLEQVPHQHRNIMVTFSAQDILDKLAYGLPPRTTLVKLSCDVSLSESLIQSLKTLKKDHYKITVNWTSRHESRKELFQLCDYICINTAGSTLPELTGICRKLESYDAKIIASQVHSQTRFNICADSGFKFFQGNFFKQLEQISTQKLTAGSISRFKLMKAIEQTDPDFEALAKIIQEDVTISFKLLSHLNAAAFGFKQKIDSVKDAITMLGWHNLRNWLRVVVLGEISTHQHTSELVFLSAQRGKFLEQVGKDHDFWGFDPDSLFLLGMFSLLDALLQRPMAEIVKHLPLADKLKSALCMKPNNEYVPLLNLARCFEEAQFDRSSEMINQLALDPDKTTAAYKAAIKWAQVLNQIHH